MSSLRDIERQADELLAADTAEGRRLSNRVSWTLQGVIRRWPFILLVQAGIFFMLRFGPAIGIDDAIHSNTNIFMSDWALVLESLVGIGVFGQAVRDARVLRFSVLMLKALIHIARHQEEQQLRMLRMERRIERLLTLHTASSGVEPAVRSDGNPHFDHAYPEAAQ